MFKKKYFIFLIILLLLLGSFLYTKEEKSPFAKPDILSVHYIDVGQGDAILIMINDKTLLIDSGPKESKKTLLKYLKKQNIKDLDYVIATHPHEDHIGNMNTIINSFKVKEFYAPKATTTSKSFDLMTEALVEHDLKIRVIDNSFNNIFLDNDIKLELLNSDSMNGDDNLNLYSPIIKLTYKQISFVFTGDAEVENELAALKTTSNLKATVLKIGHHGSTTSTSLAFLKAISPKVAIIPVGENNSYNHPSKEVLSLLKNNNIQTLRTDLDKTIVIASNGEKLYEFFPNK